MLKTNITRVFTLIMVIATLLSSTPLNVSAADTPSSWVQASVDRAKSLGLATVDLTNGYQAATTRAEFCRAAVNFLRKYGYDVDSITPKLFEDTADKDIGIAAALTITSGTDTAKNLFSPDGTLTREQAATMLRNVMNVIGADTTPPTGVLWADAKDISSWAQAAADVMYSAKVMGGTSTTTLVFSPKTPYTHEQSIVTLVNLWEYAQKAEVTTHEYDMNDPNVKKYPIYATAKNVVELKKGTVGWQSASEVIVNQKNPDNTIDGVLFYDLRMKPVQEWVDNYVAANRLSYKGKPDYQKTEIIRNIIEDGLLEEFINLWDAGFKFTTDDCVPRSRAMEFLMIALDFNFFKTVRCDVWSSDHVTNAYWSEADKTVKFIDAELGFGVWNIYEDELDEQGFILTAW
ncbi:hypothetical protein FACS1894208_11980 [Clostridia bacterium]|nr:hypothetical protein FACS1894208_11980 [Clostridia bacterium]